MFFIFSQEIRLSVVSVLQMGIPRPREVQSRAPGCASAWEVQTQARQSSILSYCIR